MIRLSSSATFLTISGHIFVSLFRLTPDISIVKYSMSTVVNGMLSIEVRVHSLDSRLLRDVLVTSEYDYDALHL
jgi:hypothetical protein